MKDGDYVERRGVIWLALASKEVVVENEEGEVGKQWWGGRGVEWCVVR